MPYGITLKCKKCGHKWEVWLGPDKKYGAYCDKRGFDALG